MLNTGEDAQAKIEQEVVADLVGDYLFTDKAFVQSLSTGNRNVFQKIWDEIKYLCKTVTAGSKEARQLLEVKKIFEEAYRAETKNPTGEGGVRYALSDAKVPTREDLERKLPIKVVDISTPQTHGSFAERRKQILRNLDEVISKPYRNIDTGAMIFLTEKSYTHAFSNSGEAQLNAVEHLPELIENAILTHAETKTHGSDYANGVYTFFSAAKAGRIHPVKLKVKEYTYSGQDLPKNIKEYFDNNPQDYAASYDTVVLEVQEIEESPTGSVKDMNLEDSFLDPDGLLNIKIADLLSLVKGDAQKYIPSRSKSAVDQAYTDAVNRGDMDMAQKLVDQAARDAGAKTLPNGRLISYYHGTNKSFTSFDAEKARLGNHGFGFYVTPVKDFASGYGEPMKIYLMTDNLATSKDHRITEAFKAACPIFLYLSSVF